MSAGTAGGGGGSAAGAGAVVRQGHLRKLKTMRKKYFVLRAQTADCSARLEYYESEKKFRAGAAPRRTLPLKSCYNITRRLDLKQKHVIALFTKEEQFCVVAENEVDLHAWLTDILKQHGSDDASEELLHPIQHVWQVNVQKKGLGASKNIQGLYNLCLTDKTLALVKIKTHNNVISDLGIPERVEYSLKYIRRCGDSESFFYMEVGRQTSTGAGELWMHSGDSNIAQSMNSTIYLAMKNCAKMTENERDHIILPANASQEGTNPRPPRRQTYSGTNEGGGRAALANDKGLCVGSCIRNCVCSTATYSVDDSAAAIAPLTPKNAENQPPNNSLLSDKPETARIIKHHRTVSLPTGCTLFQEPLKIVHERTRSAPLTGDEVDRITSTNIDKMTTHSSCKAVNGTDGFPLKAQWARRASTGTRMAKRSPGHPKNAGAPRNRCDSMPSRACISFEAERQTPRHNDLVEGNFKTHWRSIKECFGVNTFKNNRMYMSSDSLLHLLASIRREERSNVYSRNEVRTRSFNTRALSMPSNVKGESFCREAEMNAYVNLKPCVDNVNRRHGNLGTNVKSHDLYVSSNRTHKETILNDNDEMDEDRHFSMMLIPMLKKLNEEQKHYAKVDILNVMNRARNYQSKLDNT